VINQGSGMAIPKLLRAVGLILLASMFAGCQPKVYLMPPPIGIQPEGVFFHLSERTIDENLLYTLYATNRAPFDISNRSDGYTIFPSDQLKLGFAIHRVGEGNFSWEEIYDQSLQRERSKKILLSRDYVREVVTYDIGADLEENPSQAEGFFQQINEILEKRTMDKDILVYVHGANSGFYRATAQGAQFFHFTGHNTLVLTFSWPSAKSLLKYKIDVLHARQTIPAFARLIELLATRTKARRINILAYSAGALVTAPGLTYLVDRYPDLSKEEIKQKLRIGEVYFAAPDAEFRSFAERYLKFKDIVGRTTININQNDSVLKLSAFQNGMSRLGRPDPSEVSPEQLQILIDASRTPEMDVLDISGSEYLQAGGAHNSWYNHPWVSNDALALLLFKASPLQRGLDEFRHEDGSTSYRFPPDYESRFKAIVDQNRDTFLQQIQSEARREQ
jgi:esterase/lipase superfamily enzyme